MVKVVDKTQSSNNKVELGRVMDEEVFIERRLAMVDAYRARMESKEEIDLANKVQAHKDKLAELVVPPWQEIETVHIVQKPLTLEEMIKTKLERSLTCGQCEGFASRPVRHPTQVCSRLETGRRISNDPICSLFSVISPRDQHLSHDETDALMRFSDILATFPEDKLHILTSVLLTEMTTRKYGLRYMQRVYYRYKGCHTDNYLDNFVMGYVLSASPVGVRLTSFDLTSIIEIQRGEDDDDHFKGNGPTLYTMAAFDKLRPFMMGRADHVTNSRLLPENNRLLSDVDPDKGGDGENIDGNDKPAAKKAKPDEVLSVDELLALTCSTDESKFKVVETDKGKSSYRSSVRDLVDITSDLSRAVVLNTGYYDGDDQQVTDSGLSSFYSEEEPNDDPSKQDRYSEE